MFAQTLKELRNAQNLTQSELAKAIGVNLRTLQNYELGVCLPKSPLTLNRIAAYFNVPLQSLVKSDDFYRLLASEKKERGREQDRMELYRTSMTGTDSMQTGRTPWPWRRRCTSASVTSRSGDSRGSTSS